MCIRDSYYTGKKFTVIAHNNSINNVYIQKALLNGQEYNKCYLDFADIAAGGTLELFMGCLLYTSGVALLSTLI